VGNRIKHAAGKIYGSEEDWQKATDALEDALKEKGLLMKLIRVMGHFTGRRLTSS